MKKQTSTPASIGGSTGSTIPVEQEMSVVTYDEDRPPEAHAVPIEADPVPVEGPVRPTNYTDDGRPQSQLHAASAAAVGGSHGCDISLCGDIRLRQLSPGSHFAVHLCGNAYIDLLNSQYPPGTKITFFSVRLCGNVNLIVPPGTHIVVRRLLLCGNRDIHVDDDPEQEAPAPRLTIYILSLCGDIRVRSDRTDMSRFFHRSFGASWS